jgi:hypothetical protein
LTVRAVFEKLRAALETAGIPYFVTGSFASSAHGIPRSTNDIDIVIAPTRPQWEQLLQQLHEADFATDLEDPFAALQASSLFNIVDYDTLWKIDLIFKQPGLFDSSRLRVGSPFAGRFIAEKQGFRTQPAERRRPRRLDGRRLVAQSAARTPPGPAAETAAFRLVSAMPR